MHLSNSAPVSLEIQKAIHQKVVVKIWWDSRRIKLDLHNYYRFPYYQVVSSEIGWSILHYLVNYILLIDCWGFLVSKTKIENFYSIYQVFLFFILLNFNSTFHLFFRFYIYLLSGRLPQPQVSWRLLRIHYWQTFWKWNIGYDRWIRPWKIKIPVKPSSSSSSSS